MFWNKDKQINKDNYQDKKYEMEIDSYTDNCTDKYLEIGRRLKQARVNKGLTQQEVGKIIGKADVTVQRYENGVIKTVPINIIEQLSNLYDVSPIWILNLDKYAGMFQENKTNLKFIYKNNEYYYYRLENEVIHNAPLISVDQDCTNLQGIEKMANNLSKVADFRFLKVTYKKLSTFPMLPNQIIHKDSFNILYDNAEFESKGISIKIHLSLIPFETIDEFKDKAGLIIKKIYPDIIDNDLKWIEIC